MCRKIVSGFIVMLFVSLEPVLRQVADVAYNPQNIKLTLFTGIRMDALRSVEFYRIKCNHM